MGRSEPRVPVSRVHVRTSPSHLRSSTQIDPDRPTQFGPRGRSTRQRPINSAPRTTFPCATAPHSPPSNFSSDRPPRAPAGSTPNKLRATMAKVDSVERRRHRRPQPGHGQRRHRASLLVVGQCVSSSIAPFPTPSSLTTHPTKIWGRDRGGVRASKQGWGDGVGNSLDDGSIYKRYNVPKVARLNSKAARRRRHDGATRCRSEA